MDTLPQLVLIAKRILRELAALSEAVRAAVTDERPWRDKSNRLLDELRSINTTLLEIQKQIGSIRDQQEAANQQQQQREKHPQILNAELHIPEAEKKEKRTNDKKHYRVQVAIAVATSLAFIAAAIYAGVAIGQRKAMIESNRINRDALETVQRAFLNCTEISATRLVVRQNRIAHAVWNFTIPCENTGTTQANAVSEAMFADRRGKEPAEDEFLGPPFNDVFVLGPRQSQDIGLMKMTELDIFGEEFPFSTKEIFAWVIPFKPGILHPPVLWGWVAYYDAFKNSRLHITEFCREMIGINVNQSNPQKPFRLLWHPCEHHNCADEYCNDYEDIARITPQRK